MGNNNDIKVMTIADIVGDVVQIFLTEADGLAQLGFNTPSVFLQVIGIDDVGLWVVHPSYVIVRANDEEGKPLPPDQQVHKQVEANFLVRWELIASIVHFPNRKGFDFPSPFEKHIGFVTPSDGTGEVPEKDPA